MYIPHCVASAMPGNTEGSAAVNEGGRSVSSACYGRTKLTTLYLNIAEQRKRKWKSSDFRIKLRREVPLFLNRPELRYNTMYDSPPKSSSTGS